MFKTRFLRATRVRLNQPRQRWRLRAYTAASAHDTSCLVEFCASAYIPVGQLNFSHDPIYLQVIANEYTAPPFIAIILYAVHIFLELHQLVVPLPAASSKEKAYLRQRLDYIVQCCSSWPCRPCRHAAAL